jgi:hypothetical protein
MCSNFWPEKLQGRDDLGHVEKTPLRGMNLKKNRKLWYELDLGCSEDTSKAYVYEYVN